MVVYPSADLRVLGDPPKPARNDSAKAWRRRRDDHRHVHTSFGSALATIMPRDIFWWHLLSPYDGTTHGRTTDK